jgi:hypothetical protein
MGRVARTQRSWLRARNACLLDKCLRKSLFGALGPVVDVRLDVDGQLSVARVRLLEIHQRPPLMSGGRLRWVLLVGAFGGSPWAGTRASTGNDGVDRSVHQGTPSPGHVISCRKNNAGRSQFWKLNGVAHVSRGRLGQTRAQSVFTMPVSRNADPNPPPRFAPRPSLSSSIASWADMSTRVSCLRRIAAYSSAFH